MDVPVARSFLPSTPGRWAARLNLEFERRAERTRVSHVEHRGPLRIQRPFYPEESGVAHVYLLHPPGGVAGGDQLDIDVEVRDGAHALLTAPAANKLYRCQEDPCRVTVKLTVREGGLVEWLPQETIAFSGARSQLTTSVHLEEGANFVGWEVLCLGRPAALERFESGFVRQTFELWREETPLFIDRTRMGEGSHTIAASWGLMGGHVLGTAVIAHPGDSVKSLIRDVLDISRLAGRAAATDLRGGVTVLRYVGSSVNECWDVFVRVWEAVRPTVAGAAAVHPRIWSY